jgi:hypothetical protein
MDHPNSSRNLAALVTGGSRGIGGGIAAELTDMASSHLTGVNGASYLRT